MTLTLHNKLVFVNTTKRNNNCAMNTIGELILKHRTLAGISQEKLAHRCGWKSQVRISNYEAGIRRPSVEVLSIIADALEISVIMLVPGALDKGVEAGLVRNLKRGGPESTQFYKIFNSLSAKDQSVLLASAKAMGEPEP